jgi:hypothetical protein
MGSGSGRINRLDLIEGPGGAVDMEVLQLSEEGFHLWIYIGRRRVRHEQD